MAGWQIFQTEQSCSVKRNCFDASYLFNEDLNIGLGKTKIVYSYLIGVTTLKINFEIYFKCGSYATFVSKLICHMSDKIFLIKSLDNIPQDSYQFLK